jgi:hypothetical protein
MFERFRARTFPFNPSPFFVFAILTNGMGDGTIELLVTRLDTDEEIYTLSRPVHFADRFIDLRLLFRITDCHFPVPGSYQFTLLVDGQWVAQRRVQVLSTEADT